MGESAEVLALRRYMADSGVPHRVTSTCRPGTGSRHNWDGTRGCGLAVDFAGPAPGRDTPQLMAVAQALLAVETQLYELIYTPLGFSIRAGRRVAPYAIADHHDHVHVSVDRGVGVRWKEPPVPDDPNVPNITGPAELHLVVGADGRCTGYYLFSPTTGEIHAWGPGAPFHGRSEVVMPV